MEKLVILTGPTAVGKTALSINLAKAKGGEIISADCMQVYRGMDIGTAKIRPEEMQGVRHHLIDCIDPDEEFHVVRFKELALSAMRDINSRGKLPIICGGTGFYIQALLYDIQFTDQAVDYDYRAALENFADNYGNEALKEKLAMVDKESADSIPAANRKRIIRALEYYHQTGETFSEHNKRERDRKSPYNFAYFVLNDNRDLLYNRIDARVDKMFDEGLEREVRALVSKGYHKGLTSMDGIGYKEMLSYIDGELSLEEAKDLIKQNSRHYAKRQLTWFRREKEVTWLDKNSYSDDEIMNMMLFELKEKGII